MLYFVVVVVVVSGLAVDESEKKKRNEECKCLYMQGLGFHVSIDTRVGLPR